MSEKHILIIGAGIAGLSAAYQLADRFKVTILEASERSGGRIHTLNDKNFSDIVEAGAEFIHGDAQNTYGLLKLAGIGYTEVGGEFYREKDGLLQVQDEMVEGWDTLLNWMSELADDMTLDDFLHRYFSGTEYTALRLQAQSYAGGFDLADPEKVSVKTLYQEWSDETPEYRIDGGYGLLVEFLETECRKKGCTILFHTEVRKIIWDTGAVILHSNTAQTFRGTHCMITVPLGILQQIDQAGGVSFQPEINDHRAALGQIGYGTVIKVVFEFHTAFWKEDMGFVFGEVPFPTWWTQLPDDNLSLTGWAGGAHADALKGASEAELLDSALFSLSKIFNIPERKLRNNLKAARVFNWLDQPYSAGAYSYAMPGSKSARQFLGKPISDTLYFCGEAIYDGPDQGTVEAAITSAFNTAALILA